MNNFDSIIIHAQAKPGAEISRCCREAALRALTDNIKFVFVHNGHEYTADPLILTNVVWNSSK